MSEADDRRDWRLYVEDMLDFAQQAVSYTHGMDQQAFIADRLTYDATLRNIELIGEAASRIPAQIRRAHPEFEWQRMVATRNRVAHAYLGIDDDVIWDIIRTDLPELLDGLRRLLEEERA